MSRPPMPPAHGGQQASEPSYKPNVNRNKTRKWVEAKHNNYDGDDWDGMDPYGEYGSYDRSAAPAPSLQPRKNSFDRTEERRAFSAGVSPSRGRHGDTLGPGTQSKTRGSSHDGRGYYRQDNTLPPPVPQHSQFSGSSPTRNAPSSTLPETPRKSEKEPEEDKPTPAFIRPSDIYKRMQQEREKELLQQTSPTRAEPERITAPTNDVANGRSSSEAGASRAPSAMSADRQSSQDEIARGRAGLLPSDAQVPQQSRTSPSPAARTTSLAPSSMDTSQPSPATQATSSQIAAAPVISLSPVDVASMPPATAQAAQPPSDLQAAISDDRISAANTVASHASEPNWSTIPTPQVNRHLSTVDEGAGMAQSPEPNWTAIASPPVSHGFNERAVVEDVGSGEPSKDSSLPTTTASPPAPDVGDIYLSPLHFDRNAPSAASSVPPTPPAKDTPKVESHENQKAYFAPTTMTKDDRVNSFDDSDGHEPTESDRLREDIVRSLLPAAPTTKVDTIKEKEKSLPEPNRTSQISLFPSGPASNTRDAESEARQSLPAATSRPDLLKKRFSWENRDTAFFNPSSLGPEVDLPQVGLHVVNAEAEVQSPEREEPAPVEEAQAARISSSDSSRPQSNATSTGAPPRLNTSLVTPIPGETFSPITPMTATEGRPSLSSDYPPESAVSDRRMDTNDWPSAEDYATLATVQEDPHETSTSARIPPFREILAIKNADDRIATYNTTRKQFADVDTGLRNWLTLTMAVRPEHEHLSTAGPTFTPGGAVPNHIRHRPAQSIVRLAKGLAPSSKSDSPGFANENNANGIQRKATNSEGGNNVEKMQTMGKDLLSSAGKLGGKGVVGAKGWLAKGRQKLRETSSGGGEKVD